MFTSAEVLLWKRYLVVDRIRRYQKQLKNLPNLKDFRLNLGGSVLDEEPAQLLVDAIDQSNATSTLEQLCLEEFKCNISTWKLLETCLLSLKNITRLFIRRITILQDDDDDSDEDRNEEENEEILAKSICKRLKKETYHQDCDRYQPLIEIHIINSDMSSLGAQLLAQSLGSDLQILSLEGNPIGDAGVRCLTESYLNLKPPNNAEAPLTTQTRCCRLKALSLESVGVSEQGVLLLVESLRFNTHLKSLNLEGNRLGSTAHVLERLVDILSTTNRTLQHIRTTSPRGWEIAGTKAASRMATAKVQLDFWLRLNRTGRRRVLEYNIPIDHEKKDGNTSGLYTSEELWWPLLLERVADSPDLLYYYVRARPSTLHR